MVISAVWTGVCCAYVSAVRVPSRAVPEGLQMGDVVLILLTVAVFVVFALILKGSEKL